MDKLHAEIVPIQEGQITGEERLRERVANVYGSIMGYQGRPTDSQVERLDVLEKDVKGFDRQVQEVISTELPAINSTLEKEGLTPISVISYTEFSKEK